MYVKQTCNIELAGKYRLRGLHSVEIKKSVHQIVQSAKLQLPLSVMKLNNDLSLPALERVRLIDNIKEGDTIKIELGYNGNNREEFTGFIKRINLKQPLELELEDEMYLFRKIRYTTNFKKATLKQVLTYLLAKYNQTYGLGVELYDKIPDLTMTNFLIENATGIEVLQSIADIYLQSSYLTTINEKKVLYCGLLYGLARPHINYSLNRNTVSADDLKYDQSEVIKYFVKIVNFRNDGSKHEYSYGNKKDTAIQKNYNGDYTDVELKRMAEAEIAQQVTGYRGSIETMLIPNVEPGNIAVIKDTQFGREGRGYIGTVTTTFGSGARRKPEIDISL